MEFGKVIPEAEEALEHSLMMPPPQLERKFTPSTLKEMAKDVDKLISRLPYHRTQIQPQPYDQTDNPIPEPEKKLRDVVIGKYNPIGQIYRYEQAEFQLQVSKPDFKEESKTEQNIQIHKQKDKEFSVRDRDSVFAEESLTNSEMKFPTHNYYIMFDKKHRQKEVPKVSRTVCLERKVQKLENEVKMLRGATTSTNFHRSDGKMKLDKLLDSIIG